MRGTGVAWACSAVVLITAGCGATTNAPAAEPPLAPSAQESAPTSAPTSAPSAEQSPERGEDVSRSGARADVPEIEIMAALARRAERIAKELPQDPVPVDVDRGSNRGIGYQLMLEFGFPADQWRYLDALWQRESGWNHLAENPSSGAYGIPQSLPASKMAVVGGDWRTNPETQIRWGLAYISARYQNPQKAWQHSERVGWY